MIPVSIIIPAHNEASVIRRCLETMLRDSGPRELEIIVVCNGCRDQTAAIVRTYGAPVRLLETPTASKVVALNLGDAAATRFPRFYVDADVILAIDAIREVARFLAGGKALAAAPRMRVNLESVPWPIRAYYRTWLSLPYHCGDMIGSGVYALSRDGRRRFTEFPDIIADDGYIMSLFRSGERKSVRTAEFTIVPPRTVWDLVRIKTRARLGTYEWEHRYPELARNVLSEWSAVQRRLLWPIHHLPASAAYLLISSIARFRARKQFRAGEFRNWERDESSRQGVGLVSAQARTAGPLEETNQC